MSEPKASSDRFSPVLKRWLWAAVVMAVLVLAAYVVRWAVEPKLTAKWDPGSWGQFGDYVGGTLNPILAFFSFVGVLWTVHLQQVELSAARAESAKKRLQELIAMIDKRVVDIAEQPIEELGGGRFCAQINLNARQRYDHHKFNRANLRALIPMGRQMATELEDLSELLERWGLVGGEEAVRRHYSRRNSEYAACLWALGFVTDRLAESLGASPYQANWERALKANSRAEDLDAIRDRLASELDVLRKEIARAEDVAGFVPPPLRKVNNPQE